MGEKGTVCFPQRLLSVSADVFDYYLVKVIVSTSWREYRKATKHHAVQNSIKNKIMHPNVSESQVRNTSGRFPIIDLNRDFVFETRMHAKLWSKAKTS